ncbi:MAG: zf-HC2 domain-containing protein [Actinomycetota bacterium]
MNHPDELLPDYADGALGGRDLESVRSHLPTCGRCREAVALAGAGRRAVRSMSPPVVPAGLGDAAIREAERRTAQGAPRPVRETPAGQPPAWYRWAGIAAGVAAVLVLVALVLPRVGQGPSGAASAEGSAAKAPTGPLTLEVQHGNYDTASLQALGVAFGATVVRSSSAPVAQAETSAGAALPAGSLSPEATPKALACVQKAWPTLDGQDPVRLIAARYEGRPAYLAFYLQGPGAGEPPDLLSITVTWAGSCGFGPTFAHQLG